MVNPDHVRARKHQTPSCLPSSLRTRGTRNESASYLNKILHKSLPAGVFRSVALPGFRLKNAPKAALFASLNAPTCLPSSDATKHDEVLPPRTKKGPTT